MKKKMKGERNTRIETDPRLRRKKKINRDNSVVRGNPEYIIEIRKPGR